ncbi:uncharacterized protein K452DRAFT_292889, partial [Aplosporella prunicola CBS 121167]
MIRLGARTQPKKPGARAFTAARVEPEPRPRPTPPFPPKSTPLPPPSPASKG